MSNLLRFYFDNQDRVLLHETDTVFLTCTNLNQKLPKDVRNHISKFLTSIEKANFSYYNNETFPEQNDEYFIEQDNDFLLDPDTGILDYSSDNDYYKDYEEEDRLYYQDLLQELAELKYDD